MSSQHPMDRHVMTPLAEATDGALTIRIFPAGELGAGPNQQCRRAVTAVADIALDLPSIRRRSSGARRCCTCRASSRRITMNVPGALSTFSLIMNRQAWERLTDEHRAALEAGDRARPLYARGRRLHRGGRARHRDAEGRRRRAYHARAQGAGDVRPR
jgi:hypothetical protein